LTTAQCVAKGRLSECAGERGRTALPGRKNLVWGSRPIPKW